MTPERAAFALRRLFPDLAVPIHWGTFYPLGMKSLRPDPLTSPPFEFAEFAEKLVPQVEVSILQPGASLALDRAEAT